MYFANRLIGLKEKMMASCHFRKKEPISRLTPDHNPVEIANWLGTHELNGIIGD
jgi:hypothetical protein